MPKIKMPVYPGLSHSLEYDHHVNHMTAQLARRVEPDQLSAALKRVASAVRNGQASRIEALAGEIKRASQ